MSIDWPNAAEMVLGICVIVLAVFIGYIFARYRIKYMRAQAMSREERCQPVDRVKDVAEKAKRLKAEAKARHPNRRSERE